MNEEFKLWLSSLRNLITPPEHSEVLNRSFKPGSTFLILNQSVTEIGW